jgi:hypothetical protein
VGGMAQMSETEGWKVEYIGGPMDGSIRANANLYSRDALEMVASLTVLYALNEGVGAIGELTEGGFFQIGYKYEVVSIDHEQRVVVAALKL